MEQKVFGKGVRGKNLSSERFAPDKAVIQHKCTKGTVRADGNGVLFFRQAEASDKSLSVSPVLFDLDPALQIDLYPEEFLEFDTGSG